MVKIERTGPDPQVLGFQILSAAHFVVPNSLDRAQDKMLELAKANVARGRPYLTKRSGTLQAAIMPRRMGKLAGVEVDLAKVKYARIQELGGVIRPKRKPYLAFKINGVWIRAQSVTIPKRPYLEPARRSAGERLPEIVYAVIDEVMP